ncbi:hypothetical protein OV320_0496 [Actinobacteria bacterium OV320]|nr:hypothetical protein OV320_0496 [Actinobacteria bacterium OV320]
MNEYGDIVEVAGRVLRELDRWPEAAALAGPLAALVRRASAETDPDARAGHEDELYRLLSRHETTRHRMDELLPSTVGWRGLEPTFSSGTPVAKDRFVCPREDHYVWTVLGVDDPDSPPERCPVHTDVALVFRAAGFAAPGTA